MNYTTQMDADKKGIITEAMDSEKSKRYRAESKPHDEESCLMCRKMCSMRL